MLTLLAMLHLGCVSTPVVAPQVSSSPLTLDEILDEGLDSVVMVLEQQTDGSLRHSAGLFVGTDQVLTHFDGSQLDSRLFILRKGSLSRISKDLGPGHRGSLADYGDQAVAAQLVKVDAINALALLQVNEASGETLVFSHRKTDMSLGESVYALGHPEEGAWSIGRGVVTAVGADAVQHDAASSEGSIGGPLLDAEGRLVGINAFKVLRDPMGNALGGIGYARPISAGAPLFQQASQINLEQSLPEETIRSFFRAVEMGREEGADLVNFDGLQDVVVLGDQLIREWLGEEKLPGVWATICEEWGIPYSEQRVDEMKNILVQMELAGDPQKRAFETSEALFSAALGNLIRGGSVGALHDQVSSFEDYEERYGAKLNREAFQERLKGVEQMSGVMGLPCGLDYRVEDASRLTELLKRGLEVDQSWTNGKKDLAWVAISGSAADGSELSCALQLEPGLGGWVIQALPDEQALSQLPAGFPSPLSSVALAAERYFQANRDQWGEQLHDVVRTAQIEIAGPPPVSE